MTVLLLLDVIGATYLAAVAVVMCGLMVVGWRTHRARARARERTRRGHRVGGFLPPEPGDVNIPVRWRRGPR